jgi:hypothetical protein
MGYLLNLQIKMAILLKTRPVNKDVQMKKLEKIHNDLKNWVETNNHALQVPNMGAGYVGGEKNEIHTALVSIKEWAESVFVFTEQFKD